MNRKDIEIATYDDALHREQVIALWKSVFGYEASYNAPELVIDQKVEFGDGLFFVAASEGRVTGTAMAGFDGHRGWIYTVAVAPDCRGRGIGTALVDHCRRELAARGCLKVNLQIRADNEEVKKFYEANGFLIEDRLSMGMALDGK